MVLRFEVFEVTLSCPLLMASAYSKVQGSV